MKQLLSLLLPFFFFLTVSGQNSTVKQLNAVEFEKLMNDSSGTLLDVRTSGEYKNGHITDAGQLNYYAFDFRRKLLLLPKSHPVYLYCNTGYRSQRAAAILIKNGYKNVSNLENGIMEWNLKNLPIIVEPDAKPDIKDKMERDEFNALINSDKLVFVDFYAPWCAPCRKMMPMMNSLEIDYKNKITIVKINADASKKLIKELGIVSVPYLVLYHQGSILFAQNGAIVRPKLEKVFNKHDVDKR